MKNKFKVVSVLNGSYNINGSNWYLSFKPNGNNIEVIQQNVNSDKVENFLSTFKINNNGDIMFFNITDPSSQHGYTWMIRNNEWWVKGQGEP